MRSKAHEIVLQDPAVFKAFKERGRPRHQNGRSPRPLRPNVFHPTDLKQTDDPRNSLSSDYELLTVRGAPSRSTTGITESTDWSGKDWPPKDWTSAKDFSAKEFSAREISAKDFAVKSYSAKDFSQKDFSAKCFPAKEFSAKDASAREFATKDFPAKAKEFAAKGWQGKNEGEESPAEQTKNGLHKKTQYHKTKLCPWHKDGKCFMAETCNYAHSREELRPKPDLSKTKLCPEVVKGRQCHRNGCRFAHDFVELRATSAFFKTRICKFWQRGFCPAGVDCRHAHGKEDLRLPQAPPPNLTQDSVREVRSAEPVSKKKPRPLTLPSPSFLSTMPSTPLATEERAADDQAAGGALNVLRSWIAVEVERQVSQRSGNSSPSPRAGETMPVEAFLPATVLQGLNGICSPTVSRRCGGEDSPMLRLCFDESPRSRQDIGFFSQYVGGGYPVAATGETGFPSGYGPVHGFWSASFQSYDMETGTPTTLLLRTYGDVSSGNVWAAPGWATADC